MECDICKRKFLNSITFSNHKNIFHNRKPSNKIIIEKDCGICKKILLIEEFRKIKGKKKYYRNSYCNNCEKRRNIQYAKNHPEWAKKNNKKGYFKWKQKMIGTDCLICGENRTLDIAHIIPRNGRERKRSLDSSDNLLGLCPTHHRLFDEEKLNDEEYEKIKEKVEYAKKKYG